MVKKRYVHAKLHVYTKGACINDVTCLWVGGVKLESDDERVGFFELTVTDDVIYGSPNAEILV